MPQCDDKNTINLPLTICLAALRVGCMTESETATTILSRRGKIGQWKSSLKAHDKCHMRPHIAGITVRQRVKLRHTPYCFLTGLRFTRHRNLIGADFEVHEPMELIQHSHRLAERFSRIAD
jgi:hypothetical protein